MPRKTPLLQASNNDLDNMEYNRDFEFSSVFDRQYLLLRIWGRPGHDDICAGTALA